MLTKSFTVRAGVSLGALAAIGCSVGEWFRADATPKLVVKEGAHERSFVFTYTAKIPKIPAGAKQIDLWIPLPQSTHAQSVVIEEVTAPVEHSVATEPESGNAMAHFRLSGATLLPGEFTVKSRVHSIERLHDAQASAFTDAPAPRTLEPDALVPLSGPSATMADQALAGTTDRLAAGEKLYRAVLEHMKYSKDGTGWGRGDVAHACATGAGNCTDFHALFIGMARSKQIPARFIMGFSIPDAHGAGEVKGYHCWAEFWVDGTGWVPVDASEADKHPELADYYFGSLTADRVAFTGGRDLMLAPAQQGPRLNFFIYPYAEVDGKPFDGVERAFAYQDV